MRDPSEFERLGVKPNPWPRRAFILSWLLALGVVVTVVLGMSACDARELAAVRRLGGVLWAYQNTNDSQLFVVRHGDGFFGLVYTSIGDGGIFLVFGAIGLLATGIAHLRHKASWGPLAVLGCFMAPQAIGLAVFIPGMQNFPDGVYEMQIDPAAGTVTTADGPTIRLCGITGGTVGQDTRWLDADVTDDGKIVTVDSFRRQDTAQALVDELLAARNGAHCSE